MLAISIANIKAVWGTNASIPAKLFWTVKSGAVIIAAVVALGVLTIVIPIVYLISVSVGNTLPAGGLSAGQSSTLQTLVANGGSALLLTTTAETVSWEKTNRQTGAGILVEANLNQAQNPARCLPIGFGRLTNPGNHAVQESLDSLRGKIASKKPQSAVVVVWHHWVSLHGLALPPISMLRL